MRLPHLGGSLAILDGDDVTDEVLLTGRSLRTRRDGLKLAAKARRDGKAKNLLIYGDFKSGEGSYGLIDFDSLQGKISSQHGILDFRDVYIMIDGDQIFAPYLRIVNGKLKLGSIYYESDGGTRKKLM